MPSDQWDQEGSQAYQACLGLRDDQGSQDTAEQRASLVTRDFLAQRDQEDCQDHRVPPEPPDPLVCQGSWDPEDFRDWRVLLARLEKRASVSTNPAKNTSWHQADRELQEPWDHLDCQVNEEPQGSVEPLASLAK